MATEKDNDPAILCFQHCDRDKKVFCFQLPKFCYICDQELETAELRIPPFRIPFPFTEAKRGPCAIVIKPTNGDFLNAYQNSADLHIGVTNSKGIVFEYNTRGMVNRDTNSWSQCLTINVVRKLDRKMIDYWDYMLDIVACQEKWTCSRYHQNDHNCYHFVLCFLRALQISSLRESLQSKTSFCEQFIVPRTTSAGKYISLFRRLKEDKVVIYK